MAPRIRDVTTTTPTTPKPRRRWLQFSLRTLLVLMLVASLPMSWLAVELRRGRQQRAAVLAVQKMGGDVRYERDASGRLRTSVPWLMGLLGEESHANVHVVGLFNRPVTDSDLIHLRRLGNLRRLDIARTAVSDVGLAHLQGLTRLQVLINNTQVTDAGVNELKKALPNTGITR